MAVGGMVLGMVAAIIFVNVAGPQTTPRSLRCRTCCAGQWVLGG